MSLDNKKWLEQRELYPEVLCCIRQSKSPDDALPSYEYLFNLKNKIPPELYAYYFRKLLQFNTKNDSSAFRLKMFEGVSSEDIMYNDELDAISRLPEYVTIYRGTSSNEEIPGLSWSLKKHIASEYPFNRGRVFEAVIPRKSILLYFAHEEAEEEIIAHVTSGYRVIEENFLPVQ